MLLSNEACTCVCVCIYVYVCVRARARSRSHRQTENLRYKLSHTGRRNRTNCAIKKKRGRVFVAVKNLQLDFAVARALKATDARLRRGYLRNCASASNARRRDFDSRGRLHNGARDGMSTWRYPRSPYARTRALCARS